MRYVATREDRAPAMRQVVDEVRARGGKPFEIPLGASTPLGALGIARGVGELARQGITPDVIVHASSSGGTQAGLLIGCALFGLHARVIGISADDPAARSATKCALRRATKSSSAPPGCWGRWAFTVGPRRGDG